MEHQHKIKNSKGFFRFLIFLLLFAVLDMIGGKALQFLYHKQKSGYDYRTSYAIDSTKAPGLIFGSSRANHHYVTTMLADSFDIAFYNVGRDGQSIFYDYALLQSILRRYTPKMILLDYQDEELYYLDDSYARLSVLLPFAKSHPEINRIVQLRSGFENMKMISRVYPYNSLFFNIIGGISAGAKGKVEEVNGYLPLDNPFHSLNADRNKFLSTKAPDTNKIKTFDAFVNLCKEKGIELYLVMSPYLDEVNEKLYEPIEERIRIANVPYFDYSRYPDLLGKKEYFSDEKHLNRKGSEIFTEDLINNIRDYRQSLSHKQEAPAGINLPAPAGNSLVGSGSKDSVNLIVLFGESNASGMAPNSPIKYSERELRQNVKILNNSNYQFESLKIGVNNNILQNQGTLKVHGFENGLANAVDAGQLPKPLFLVKAGSSGALIKQWLKEGTPSNNQMGWQTLQSRMDAAVHYLQSQHILYKITVWESIGINDFNAKTSSSDFTNQMLQFRTDFRNRYGKNIPFLITLFFASHPYNPVIQAIADQDPLHVSAAVITEDASRVDAAHWDYKGLKLIAGRMVEKMNTMQTHPNLK